MPPRFARALDRISSPPDKIVKAVAVESTCSAELDSMLKTAISPRIAPSAPIPFWSSSTDILLNADTDFSNTLSAAARTRIPTAFPAVSPPKLLSPENAATSASSPATAIRPFSIPSQPRSVNCSTASARTRTAAAIASILMACLAPSFAHFEIATCAATNSAITAPNAITEVRSFPVSISEIFFSADVRIRTPAAITTIELVPLPTFLVFFAISS